MDNIEYIIEMNQMTFDDKCERLRALTKNLNITDEYRLRQVLEFARLFDEFNKDGWLRLED